jgi:thiol-disulfide isomerase/thioredoxin
MKYFPFVFLMLFLSAMANAQMAHGPVKVITFAELQQEMNIQDDTLRVFNFWATWCKPCVEEMPCFTEAGKSFAQQKVKIILVSLDFRKHLESRLVPFIEKNQISLPVWLLDAPDANAWIDRVSPQWEGSIPATLFTRQGQKYFYETQFECNLLKSTINQYLKP